MSNEEENAFGDFEEVKEEGSDGDNSGEGQNFQGTIRIKLPRGKEILGVVKQRLGGNRMEIQCVDGKTRNCRVPGRFKKRFWLRTGDAVLIEPWEYDNDKGDIVYQYNKNGAYQLKKKGMLDSIKDGF